MSKGKKHDAALKAPVASDAEKRARTVFESDRCLAAHQRIIAHASLICLGTSIPWGGYPNAYFEPDRSR